MPVKLSIQNAADGVVQHLRERAARNHLSLQGELMAIIEEAVKPGSTRPVTIDEYCARLRALELSSRDEAAAIIRADRDAGHRDH